MRIAILGCGYVGLQLCRELLEFGHEVIGVRRSDTGPVTRTGADAISGDLTQRETLERLPPVDAVVFAASSGGGDVEAAREIYVDGLRTVIRHFGRTDRSPDRFVYTSSTGVYGDHGGDWVDEATPIDPTTPKTTVLAEAESIAHRAVDAGMDPTVARIAGIYGPERWGIERYLDGPVTAGYRNHIHREDVAGAIAHLLVDGDGGEDLVLLCDDEPVDRWQFADWLAERLDRPEPPKVTVEERLATEDLSERTIRRLQSSKRCDNGRLRELGYDLRYPTYRQGYMQAIRSVR